MTRFTLARQNTEYRIENTEPEELVHVELDEGDRNGLLLLAVLSCHLDEKVQDHFIDSVTTLSFSLHVKM